MLSTFVLFWQNLRHECMFVLPVIGESYHLIGWVNKINRCGLWEMKMASFIWVCLYTAFVGSGVSWWRLWKKQRLIFLTLEWVVIVVGGCDDTRQAGFNFGFEVGGRGQMDTQDTLMKLCWQLLSVKSVMYLVAMNVSLWAYCVGDVCAIVSCN